MRIWDHVQRLDTEDAAFGEYLDSCEDYLRRQLVVYQNWPQHKYGPMGYTGEKQFVDQNA